MAAAPKEPTKHLLSTRLTYSQHTPVFCASFRAASPGSQTKIATGAWSSRTTVRVGPLWPYTGRPPIPERPSSDPESGGDDRDNEAPQVVALKEGNHLSTRGVEIEKHKGKWRGNSSPDISTLESASWGGGALGERGCIRVEGEACEALGRG
jgi:hypothetical protein